jgi:hypothetical protein
MTTAIKALAAAAALAGLLALAAGAAAASRHPAARAVSDAALAAAGRQARLKDIDYNETHCDADLTVEAWLRTLVGRHARAIAWSGGRCVLINARNPLDSGSDWCAQATVTLAHPERRDDRATVEVYFEKPVHGRPGVPYAFRGLMATRDGPDYTRFRKDFEAEWIERFGPPAGACQDEDP